MLGHGVVPGGHSLPPVLLELLALAVKLSAEISELLLELLGDTGGVDRRLALALLQLGAAPLQIRSGPGELLPRHHDVVALLRQEIPRGDEGEHPTVHFS